MPETPAVIIVTNIPNPYRVALFNVLHDRLAAGGRRLVVLFGAETYSRRRFVLDPSEIRFTYRILRSRTVHAGDNEKTLFTYGGLMDHVRRLRPVAVITSGFSMATLRLRLSARRTGIPYIIWTGSIAHPGRNDSFLRIRLRRFLVAGAAAFVAYGSRARDYLVSLGADRNRVAIGINTVDTAFFARETERLRQQAAPGPPRLTVVGYLVPRKRTGRVLEAAARVAKTGRPFVIDIVGDGEDRQALQALALALGLEEHVVFHGFKQRNELPLFLARSSGFLFQTDFDVWGLVLNEAMAAGLPCLASPNAAATGDLVQEGRTGFVVDFNDATAAAERIGWLLDHPDEGRRIGRDAARFIGEAATLGRSADGFLKALDTIRR